jgi:glycosyltransferase involved in cell wall biosynthesis
VIAAVAPRYGGPSTAIWRLSGALREVGGFRVEVATTDADGPRGVLAADALPAHAGIVHLFRRDRGETFKYSRGLGRWLADHARDYDLIHAHGQWNYPTAAACRAARRARVPYVLRPCGMFSDYSWGKSWLKKRLYWWLTERRNVRQAAAFHVTSPEEQQEVLRLGVRAPVEVIPLGVEAEAWSTPAESGWLRQQCPQAGDRPIVLFLSRLHPKKGVTDLLLPAFAKLAPDCFLVIAGGEDGQAAWYAAQVEDAVGRLGLRDRVALLGPVPPARRWAALDGAALFVLPSHSENFGQAVTEAMARGVPVVVTSGVQVAEHVAASGGGVVVPPDAAALAQALGIWLADPARRAAAAANGRRYTRATFSWRRTAELLGDLYRRVRGTTGRRGRPSPSVATADS